MKTMKDLQCFTPCGMKQCKISLSKTTRKIFTFSCQCVRKRLCVTDRKQRLVCSVSAVWSPRWFWPFTLPAVRGLRSARGGSGNIRGGVGGASFTLLPLTPFLVDHGGEWSANTAEQTGNGMITGRLECRTRQRWDGVCGQV